MEGTPKTVTVSREADGGYVARSCADGPIQPLPRTGRETGLEVGLQGFLVTAEGEIVGDPATIARARNGWRRRSGG